MNARAMLPPCPIDTLREQVDSTVAEQCTLLLQAPPGAGKSSRIPLWLLQHPCLADKKIIVVEPRRTAVRALGRYMASLLNEQPGQTVGWRIRGESVGDKSRLLVVTVGVVLRMLQTDPALENIGCIIFDEFHERSLQTDLELALCLESQSALRDDLRLVVMSATLDMEKTRSLLGNCAALTCDVRAWPVDIRWFPVPGQDKTCAMPLLRHTADVVCHALRGESGNVLVFLPGMGEMLTLSRLLECTLPSNVTLHIMHGSLSLAEQDRAMAPTAPGERKIVLATSIAESALTIEGIRVVIDCGFSRTMWHDLASGIDKLVTRRVTLDSAAQRSGRAGRTGPGTCYRLWAREEEHGMLQQATPEILHADLSGLVLALAAWGVVGCDNIRALTWTDTPPESALNKATDTLKLLGALDTQGRISSLGSRMARLPTSPRLARLLLEGESTGNVPLAACLATLLEADHLAGLPHDLAAQCAWLCQNTNAPNKQRLRRNAEVFARALGFRSDIFNIVGAVADMGPLLARAWPERIAMRQTLSSVQQKSVGFLLRTGQAVSLDASSPLAQEDFLVVTNILWRGQEGTVTQASPLSRTQFDSLFGEAMKTEDVALVSPERTIRVLRRTVLDKLTISEKPLPMASPDICCTTFCDFIRQGGVAELRRLPWEDTARQWLARVAFMRRLEGDVWPDVSEAALLQQLETWLGPQLVKADALKTLSARQLELALAALLPWQLGKRLATEAPDSWQSPAGIRHPIVYGDDGGPWLAAKLQEFFGCTSTPAIANGRVMLALHLNSPAGRPLQITRDLAHFWSNGYASVRAEMLGRYPKHPWPENPLEALPTAKSKKRAHK